MDILRFYAEENERPTVDTLFEISAHWSQLVVTMASEFQKFFQSEQYKTGKPIPPELLPPSPMEVDSETRLQDPFSLEDWIKSNQEAIDTKGKMSIFGEDHQLQVFVLGHGESKLVSEVAQMWIWQMRGESQVQVGHTTHKLVRDDSLLVPIWKSVAVSQERGSYSLVSYQEPYKAV
jgi:3-hydroxyanthranilate 3,4-dioxygenase